jgi:pimeloyl-ACP methyl ester carboxylesterase
MYISIGGIEQWIEIGGEDPSNPVLLFLHGGPGGSSRPAAMALKPWERHFTLVHWDQRGAGRTLMRNGEIGCGRLTIERMIADAMEVAEFLTNHLGKDKIILLAHSWGSVLALDMIRRRPELFSAYVGTGQVVNMRRNEEFNYTRQMGQARAAGNEQALAALDEIGPPPYKEQAKIKALREWADVLASGTGDHPSPRPPARPTNLTPEDIETMTAGFLFSGKQLFDELCDVDLPSLGLDFPIPMFCFMGTEDQQTAFAPAEAWFASLNAPRKAFVRFEGCHHFVVMNRPEMFLEQLLEHVVPAVSTPETSQRKPINVLAPEALPSAFK